MNTKTGFLWYYVDTDRYNDIKIKRLKKAHGGAGVAVMDFLLCEIYRDKGFFLEYNPAHEFNVAEYFNLSENTIFQIVTTCLDVEIFDREKYAKYGVLTSKSIQKRFVLWSEKARRTTVLIPERLKLSANNPQNDNILTQNDNILTQNDNILPRIVEYSKVCKSSGSKRKQKTTTTAENKNDLDNGFEKDDNKRESLKMPFRGADFLAAWGGLTKMPNFERRTDIQLSSALAELAAYDKPFALSLIQKAVAGGYKNLTYTDTPEKFREYKKQKKEGAPRGQKYPAQRVNDITTHTHTQNQYNGFD